MAHQKNLGLKEEALLKKMSYLGRRFHKLGVVDHVEPCHRLNFNQRRCGDQKDFLRPPPAKRAGAAGGSLAAQPEDL